MHRLLKDALSACVDAVSIFVHPLSRVLTRNRVRILGYHRVCDVPNARDYVGHVSVSPSAFALQMEFLKQNNFNVMTLDEFIGQKDANRKPPPKTIIITFDDGYRDNLVNAFPILSRCDFKATFFLVTNYIDSDEIFDWLTLTEESSAHLRENRELWVSLTSKEIVSMMPRASFGSHTMSHCQVSTVDRMKAKEEIRQSKENLEKITSKPVTCFSYPHGDLNRSVKDLLRDAGYKAAVTSRPGTNTLSSDFYQLRRTEISRRDSLSRFKRKVGGAYDWPLYLVEKFRAAKRPIF